MSKRQAPERAAPHARAGIGAVTPAGESEAERVERARQGDEDAWRTLYETHASMVFAVIRRIVRDPDTAADLSQEVWLRVVRKLDTYDARAPFGGWLATIAYREACGHVRRTRPTELAVREDDATVRPPQDRIVARLTVEAAIEALPAGYRAVIIGRMHGVPDAEIAETLGVKQVTVRTQHAKALAHLRRLLAPDAEPNTP